MAKLIIFSGAGLSAESGIATFRSSADGLWENYDINVVCNMRTFKKNFEIVHQFYNMRRTQLATVEPNAAHRQIAAWQQRFETIILTQNVDDLLERAGCKDVLHLHGFLPEMTCWNCRKVWNVGYTAIDSSVPCPHCKSPRDIKPNVVFFEQDAPAYRDLYRILLGIEADDVILVTGTSGNVINIGAYLFDQPGLKIFNSLEEPLDDFYDEVLTMPITEALPKVTAIIDKFWAKSS